MRTFSGIFTQRLAAAIVMTALTTAVVSGCKTQDDAEAAATQMVATTAALSQYYAALDQTVAANEETRTARTISMGLGDDRATLEEERQQLKVRRDLAAGIAALATALQQIVTSTAPGDTATAAGNLDGALVTLKAIPDNANATTALTKSVQALVGLVKMHDEKKAAKQVKPVADALAAFFVSEEPNYNRDYDRYLTDARSVAKELVRTDEIDATPLYHAALAPFDLTASLKEATKRKASGYLGHEIDEKFDDKLAAAKQATSAMGDALNEMASRITLVTENHPLKLRLEPVSLATVRGWIKQIQKEVQ